jgi:hypothetical protein
MSERIGAQYRVLKAARFIHYSACDWYGKSAEKGTARDPRRARFVDPSARNEGLHAPMAEWGIRFQSSASQGPPLQAGHFCCHRDRHCPQTIAFIFRADGAPRRSDKGAPSKNTGLRGSRRVIGTLRCRHRYRAARTRLLPTFRRNQGGHRGIDPPDQFLILLASYVQPRR